ncbi:MAG: acriflavin resistance protein [Porticoccus sp.]|jgi:multidrug efflux pump subunit AcrB|uniref:efflux RND transporter permease subunit n=1 Tax=Porticoccus hydrocarbonoclasticus TaxID=1073414 RepID=UPI000C4E6C8B|nr:efflux RND transporter permease subunit [Porticoccus hydrocarbonoclasticus]MBG58065.1 acriflavin resistance protein [Porticoccus sp.]|tara:strand:- start:86766 stop:89867 length:3102 start_codon:yes stop_codon:yes gene_type:complete
MIRWFAGHPTAANLLLILLLAAGLFAAPALKRETFPDYRPVEVSVQVIYRGASAADVEDAVCRRLHDAIKGVDYLDEMVCVAQDNLASATVTMQAGGDAIRFLNDIDTEVNALTDLPTRAERPIVRELHRSDLVAAVAVSGDMSSSQLEDYALRLEERIMTLRGVAQVTLQGLSQRQWQVEVPRAVLAQYGLSASDLAARVRQQSIDVPLGTLETRDRDVLLRFTDQRRSLQELAALVVVSGAAGGELTLADIATLKEVGEQPEAQVYFNGKRAVVLEVSKSLRDDALSVMDELTTLVESERLRLQDTIQLKLTQNMTSIVRERLEMLVSNGIMGLVLLVLVMGLFFRPRLALWAVLGLPVAFMGAFFVMSLSGLSLNMITLVALLMAIGIVMDDAVVIADNIVVQAKKNVSPLTAVVEGTRQVLPGVMSSFLTTVWVFAPLAFLAGELGAVLEVLPVVLIAALAASLIEAFWILPHHLKGSIAILRQDKKSRFRRAFDDRFELFQERVGKLADLFVQWRHAVLGMVLLVLLGTVGFMAGGHIGTEAMPDMDGDTLEARLLMPQGTPLARTEAAAAKVEAAVRQLGESLPAQPDAAPLVQATQVRFNYNPSAREAGAHVATVMVDLLSAERRNITLDGLTTAWRDEIGDITGLASLIIQEPGFGPAGVPIEVRLQAESLDDLKVAALELADHLAGYEAVYNIIDDLRPGKPQRTFQLTDGALALGLTADMVATQLRGAFLGEIADTQRIGQQDVEILVRQGEGDRSSLEDLADQSILLPDGRQVSLEVVVQMKKQRDWAMITRINGLRTVTVQANVDARLASAQTIVNAIRENWLDDFQTRHPAVKVSFEGQVASSAETGGSIARGLMIGLLGIFVILSFQFRSYAEPFIVMLAIPLAFVGALWGHVLMGWYISMPSMIGAASLAGIVVNDAILLVQFIKENRSKGLTAIVAAGQSSRDRLRAILITSTTTIAGLLPLLAETSVQSASIKPLVISVVFGLLTTTVLVLLVIPAIYVLFDDWGWTRVNGTETEQ